MAKKTTPLPGQLHCPAPCDMATGSNPNAGTHCDAHHGANKRDRLRTAVASAARGVNARGAAHAVSIVCAVGLIACLKVLIFVAPSSAIGVKILAAVAILFACACIGVHFVSAEWGNDHNGNDQPEDGADKDRSERVLCLEDEIEHLEDAKWQLSESAARYRDLLDQHQHMIIRVDRDGVLTYSNRAFEQKFLINACQEDLPGKCLSQQIDTVIADLDAGRSSQNRSVEMSTSDGARWIEWEAQAVQSVLGDEIQYTGRDVTDAVIARKELEDARDRAQSASRAKSRFLASMSHEIRTPMNGILGMSDLLKDGTLNAQQETYVNAIDLSARNLLAIIDDILDFSRLEAGKMKFSNRYFSLEETILSVVELLAPAAHEKGLQLAWTVDPGARGEFYGDASRVRQVLMNLLSNAVKFTDTGGIRVTVTSAVLAPDKDAEQNLAIDIRVKDTGIGLSKQDCEELFFEFAQTDEALKRQSGGTGLGLVISKHLSEAMGGTLAVESVPGVGSEFIAKLRLRPVFGPSLPKTYTGLSSAFNLNVLLAFDRDLERQALVDILHDSDIPVHACTLAEADDALKKAYQSGRPFTRIIVDEDTVPDYAAQLLRHAKAIAEESKIDVANVRGLVMVNMLSRDALPAFRRHDFSAYIVRPVRPKTLLDQLLASDVARPAQTGEAGCEAEAQTVQTGGNEPLHFLLVEDNDINALLVEHQLQRGGHSLVRAKTGNAAVELVRRQGNDGSAPFDVILMDVLLPEMDGIEATKCIHALYKSTDRLKQRPPIIALTANAFDEDRERCIAAGMDDYLAKPFDQHMLDQVLKRCLSDVQAASERVA